MLFWDAVKFRIRRKINFYQNIDLSTAGKRIRPLIINSWITYWKWNSSWVQVEMKWIFLKVFWLPPCFKNLNVVVNFGIETTLGAAHEWIKDASNLFTLLPPAYVVRWEGDVFSLFVSSQEVGYSLVLSGGTPWFCLFPVQEVLPRQDRGYTPGQDMNTRPRHVPWTGYGYSLLYTYICSHLSVSPDNGAEKLPGPAAAVHSHHAQYLEEPEASQRRRREHLTAAPQT